MGQIIFFTLMLAIYFIPSIVASGKKGSDGIVALNIFAGWTGIGWLAALIWALCAENRTVKRENKKTGITYCRWCNVITKSYYATPMNDLNVKIEHCYECNGTKKD